jgi:hypothetical protein
LPDVRPRMACRAVGNMKTARASAFARPGVRAAPARKNPFARRKIHDRTLGWGNIRNSRRGSEAAFVGRKRPPFWAKRPPS